MSHVGQYRESLLNITDEHTRRRRNRRGNTPRITARFYRGEDVNIVISDLESLGALCVAIDRALDHATDPERSDEFRNLTIRVQGDVNRVTVTLAGYAAVKRAGQSAA